MEMNEPRPTFTACRDCGEALHRDERGEHRCDEARRLELVVRRELAAFEGELGTWLGTPGGRFAAWLAERDRR
jgi:uncharacterized protein with NRDE domain